MKIETSKGKTLEITGMMALLRATGSVMIELDDERALSEIAADLEGCETIKKTDEAKAGVTEVYEGYTQLIEIRRNQTTGSVRVTLTKE